MTNKPPEGVRKRFHILVSNQDIKTYYDAIEIASIEFPTVANYLQQNVSPDSFEQSNKTKFSDFKSKISSE